MTSLRRAVVVLLLASVSGLSMQVGADEGHWSDYLDGSRGERLQEAIATVEAAQAELAAGATDQMHRFEKTYIEVRNTDLKPSQALLEYSRVGDQDRGVLLARSAAMGEIHRILIDEPPPVGSDGHRAAIEWLTRAAETRFLPARLVTNLVSSILDAAPASTQREIEQYIGQIAGEESDLLAGFDAESRLRIALERWVMRFLSLPDADAMVIELQLQTRALSAFAQATSVVASAVTDVFAQIANSNDVSSSLRALSLVRASIVVDPNALGDEDAEFLGAYLQSFSRLARETRAFVAGTEPAARFAVRVLAHLMAAASDYQRYLLATRIGVSHQELAYLSGLLYMADRDASKEVTEAIAEIEFDFAVAKKGDPGTDFEHYMEDGADAAKQLSRWSGGQEVRIGDEYRWAVLSVLSNRYAQYRILTDPDLEDNRDLVLLFLQDIYDESHAYVMDAQGIVPTFDRVLITDDPGELCADFVRRAQGIESLPAGMQQEIADGLTLATAWCHTHGLQLLSTGPEDPGNYIVERVSRWFDMAESAVSRAEAYSDTVRGSLAIAEAIRIVAEPVIALAGHSNLRSVTPRLFSIYSMAEALNTFEVGPELFLSAVARVFDTEEGDRRGLVLAIAEEVDHSVFVLAELYGGDLQVLQHDSEVIR